MRHGVGKGFTIVELLIVIVVIAILAAITIVAYNGIQLRAVSSSMKSALNGAAKQMELIKVDTTTYPTTLPAEVKAPAGVMLSLAQNGTSYCINAETTTATNDQRWSYNPVDGIRSGTCSGGVIENSERGANPNLVDDTGFTLLGPSGDQWALTISGVGNVATTSRAGATGDPYPERRVLNVVNSVARSGATFAYVKGPVNEAAIIGGASYTLTYYVRVGSGTYNATVAYFGVMTGSATNASFTYVGNATTPDATWKKVTRTVNATQNGVAGTFLYLGLTSSQLNNGTFTLEFQGFEIRAN